MIYQCLGISGAIFLTYAILTMAFTNISQDWFVRGLFVFGLVGIVAFVIKSLERVWQKFVLFFFISNSIAGLYAFGQGWDWYYWTFPIIVLSILFIFLQKWKRDTASITLTLVVLTFIGAYFLKQSAQVIGSITLVGAILLNVVAFLASKKVLIESSKDDSKFTKSAIGYVYGLIVFIILVLINILSQDFHHQWDLTQNKLNTLSPQSKQILEKLDEPVSLKVFFKQANEVKLQAKMVLDQFQNQSDKVKITYIDPDVEKFLSEKYQAKDGDLVVEYKDQKYTTQIFTEEGVTQALLKVINVESLHLCFLSGHGELELNADEENVRGLTALQKGLDNEGYTYEKLVGVSDKISETCNVLIVAGPEQPITKSESDAIGSYLDGGGKAVFLLDPVFSNPNLGENNLQIKTSGLESLLFAWGVELGRNIMLQRTIAMYQGEQIVSQVTGFQYGNHPIVDPLKGKQTLFDGVQSIHTRPDFEGTTYMLIESFGKGATWTKSNMKELLVDQNANPNPEDILGPVPFAVASEKEGDAKTQLIVVGDADFISNELIVTNEFNYDLFLNMLGWMSGDSEKISIRPKMFKASAIELSDTQSKIIFYVAVIFLPMLVLLFGMNLWWIRKQRG